MSRSDGPTFEGDVFAAELEEIRRRRAQLGQPDPGRPGPPRLDRNLIGLALSGGGIRSASLSLGVLQAFASADLLTRIDYVSTVSGGGLIGSSLSALLNSSHASADPGRFPLGFEPGETERPAVKYLRNQDRYLAPGGLLDALRLPAVILRGLVDNLAVLLPVLIIAVQLTELAFVLLYRWGPDRARYFPLVALGAFAVVALAGPVLYRLAPARFTWPRRNQYERTLAMALVGVIAVLLLIPIFLLTQQAIDLSWTEMNVFVARAALFASAAVGVLLLLALAGAVVPAWKAMMRRLSLLVVGLFGYAIVLGLFLFLTVYQVDSPLLPSELRQDLNAGEVTPRLQAAFVDKGYFLDPAAHVEPHARGEYEWWLIANGGHEDRVTWWRGTLRLTNTLIWDGPREWPFMLLGLCGLAYAFFITNPNITSQHGFFRDRLSRAFVFGIDPDGMPRPRDGLKLSSLNAPGSAAPYHLLNTTLNLQGAAEPEMAGRHADYFLFSRHFVGSETTGYCETAQMERHDRHLTLGTAMAVSGAGLAPNMGTETVPALVFLLALLDLRLDYWLPNPSVVRSGRVRDRLRLAGLGPRALLKEALGRLDARGPYVNVSDGGQIENLGIYELLRRRCRWIVAIDADEDPAMTLGCLADLLRYARIDLGIEIGIRVDPLHLQPGGTTLSHWVVGDIHYSDTETGRLVLLKASLTGDEPEAVLEYWSRNPLFPQEPSSNQFFSEAQFEAYRALGEHIARHFLASEDAAVFRTV